MSVEGIIGRKVGMTQVYADDGRAFPVTVIQAGPCVVVQRKSKEKDGYSAVQLGLVEARKVKRVTKAMKGHFDKAGVAPGPQLVELRLEDVSGYTVGQELNVEVLEKGDFIDVTAVSRGKGFAGGMKRHRFSGQGASHGNDRLQPQPMRQGVRGAIAIGIAHHLHNAAAITHIDKHESAVVPYPLGPAHDGDMRVLSGFGQFAAVMRSLPDPGFCAHDLFLLKTNNSCVF